MTTTVNTDVPAYMVDGVLTDGEAWVPLSTTVISTPANIVTWTSSTGANDWSQYMDLVIITNGNTSYSSDAAGMPIYGQLNDDSTSANYTWERFWGNGSSTFAQYYASKDGFSAGLEVSTGIGADEFGGSICRLVDINSGKWKTIHAYSANATTNATHQEVHSTACFWRKTESIIKIELIADGSHNHIADSRFDLFGVLPRMVS